MEPTHHDTHATPSRHKYYPTMTPEERLAALRQIRGMWKGRTPDPVAYFTALRDTGERDLPPRRS